MNFKSQPLVSIVTPVYNEEKYLAECIESVLAQSYQNWEYTIVNNCSTDRSLEIARRYAAREPRIRIHQNSRFLEMLANHNLAVQQISPVSKYCKVVLGDDWIFPKCLEEMVAAAECYPSVGIVSAYQQLGQEVRLTGLPDETRLVDGRETCRQFLLQKLFLFGSQTSVLYRADLVRSRNPFYVETDMYADFEACFALLRTSDLGFVHEILTFSRPQAGSIGAISADIGAYYGSVLGLLFRYGRQCLTSEDFDDCLDLQLSQYYRFLGRRLLVERGPEFWFYHKKAFDQLGISFDRIRLAKSAVGQLCGSVLDPNSWIKSIRKSFLLSRIRNSQARRVVMASRTESSTKATGWNDGSADRFGSKRQKSADQVGG